ncbi:hypothetical protein GQ44DRAFT_760533 [Phaeosphaeriaceae sp. PMI808]|nr:hypothetical protein GQ44DRAFT_760533 [Phaeosphaeriaceae sp. PMI808]
MSEEPNLESLLAQSANKIASAAVSVSIAAFLMAFLPLLLGNLMPGHALWKTNKAAIGAVARRHRSWRLGLKRVEVIYPRISFKLYDLIKASRSCSISQQPSTFLLNLAKGLGFCWSPKLHVDDVTPQHIRQAFSYKLGTFIDCHTVHLLRARHFDITFIIHKNQQYVLSSELSFINRLQYGIWQVFQSELSHDRPRATWTQIIQVFDISDASSLIRNEITADTIPSTIDVPLQKVSLFDLGQLALALGCITVDIDVESRHFRAVGPHCVITTEDIPTFGKAVRFEGDIGTLMHYRLGAFKEKGWLTATQMTLGQLPIVANLESTIRPFNPVDPNIIERVKKTLEFSNQTTGHGMSRHMRREMDLLRETPNYEWYRKASSGLHRTNKKFNRVNILNTGLDITIAAKWQSRTGLAVPTIIVMAMLATVPGAYVGFPSRVFLHGIESWCMLEAETVLRDNLQLAVSKRVTQPCRYLQDAALTSGLIFSNLHKHVSFGKKSAYSWLCEELQDVYYALPNAVKEALFSCKPGKKVAYDVKALIMPQALLLLRRFDPTSWAENVREKQRNHILGPRDPGSILRLQTILLDLAIRLQIRGNATKFDQGLQRVERELKTEDMTTTFSSKIIPEGLDMMNAAIKSSYFKSQYRNRVFARPGAKDRHNHSTTQDFESLKTNTAQSANQIFTTGSQKIPFGHPTESLCEGDSGSESETVSSGAVLETAQEQEDVELVYQSWNLFDAILEHCNLYDSMGQEEMVLQCKRLAIMLKLRALFYIAFLIVGPDSSSVYEARGSQAQVPII